jgi:TetR/AcrR family transcriptional regulator, regulator of cefoperazone and chloramphenicol sensitivity
MSYPWKKYSIWNMFADWKIFFKRSSLTLMQTAGPGAGPRRRPKSGGYARGDETRAQIIAAALRVFGELGYEQASTREIAVQAGVNPPALQYYFNGKEGLHRACAEFIIERAGALLSPALLRAQQAISGGRKRAAMQALEALLDAATDTLVQAGSSTWSRFVVRGRSDWAGPGMELLNARLGMPMVQALAGLIAIVTDASAASERTRLRTLLLIGQVHWVHASKDQAMKFMQWSKLDAAKVDLIKQVVRAHTQAALKARLPARRARGAAPPRNA